jgi:phosphoglycerol transferase MdoB-like AlkP superfamily enzyme
LTKQLSLHDFLGLFFHGLRLDISTSTYIVAFVTFMSILLIYFNAKYLKWITRAATIIALIITAFIAVVDLELYKYWGFRLDTTPLMYINTPNEMVASIEWFVMLKQIVLWMGLVYLFYWLYRKLIEPSFLKLKKGNWKQMLVMIILFCSLIIPIRGGIGLAPLNTGTAYFSQNQFANHAANNVVWNLAFSFTYYVESTKNPFVYTDNERVVAVRDSLVAKESITKKVLKTNRPNIILIILESFNDKMIEPLGGKPDVTPNINKYCSEGICFSQFYGNGDRSDKGLVSIHSGFPSQTIASIIKFPYKTEKLPFFTRDLKLAGYNCSYFYGGDIDFAAMRSFIQNAHYDKIVSDEDFPDSTYGAKWGVHDGFIFEKFYDDILASKTPFLRTVFTLSSHEPFDVPYRSSFYGSSEEEKFLNAGRYTDSCLGVFINKLKKTRLWDSTLVIITADHGSNHPKNSQYFECIRFRIPMIWIGGALNIKDSIVSRIGAQTDIPFTLLNQLDIVPKEKFPYGKNLLNNGKKSFAYYTFNNGFCFINDSGKVVFNNVSKEILYKEGTSINNLLDIGKCIQQEVYSDFLKR